MHIVQVQGCHRCRPCKCHVSIRFDGICAANNGKEPLAETPAAAATEGRSGSAATTAVSSTSPGLSGLAESQNGKQLCLCARGWKQRSLMFNDMVPTDLRLRCRCCRRLRIHLEHKQAKWKKGKPLTSGVYWTDTADCTSRWLNNGSDSVCKVALMQPYTTVATAWAR